MPDVIASVNNRITRTVIVPSNRARTIEVKTGRDGEAGANGTSGAAVEIEAATNLSGHIVVCLNSLGKAIAANVNTQGDALVLLGITTGAVIAGATATIQPFGTMTEPSWTWTPRGRIYYNASGVLTQAVPTSGTLRSVGFAMTATTMFITIDTPTTLA